MNQLTKYVFMKDNIKELEKEVNRLKEELVFQNEEKEERTAEIIAQGQDITKLRQAEEALFKSDTRYRSYIDATGQIGWVTNADGEIEEDSPSLRKFSGQAFEDAKGSGWAKTLHPDDLEHTLQVWNEAVTTKSSYEVEYRMRRYDGVYRNLLARAFPIFRADGSILEWVGTCIDITERKVAEEKYQSIFENSMVGKSLTGVDGSLKVNKAFSNIVGYTMDELEGLKWQEITHHDDLNESAEVIDGLITGKTNSARYTKRYIHKNGSIVWTDISTMLQRDAEGKPLFFITNIIDITERILAETKLKESERKYSDLFNNAAIAMYRSKLDGTAILAANKKLCELFECTEEDILNNPAIIRWADPDDRKKMITVLKNTGSLRNFEIDILTKTNARRTVLTSVTLYPIEGYLEGSAFDITERKLAELALQESERKFSDTVKYLDEGYYSVTTDGILLEHNLAFNRIIGIDINRDMKGEKSPDFWQNPNERNEYLKELMSNGIIKNFEVGAKTIADEKITVILNSHLIKDENGKLLKIEGTVIDITERKKAEEKIKTTYDAFISILDAYPGILKIIDPETYEIILANKTFADKLPQYGKGKKCYEVFYALTSPCSFCTNEIIIKNNRQPHTWEHFNPVTKTDYLHIDQLIKWPDGRDVRFEIAIDISDRKKAEELLNSTLENLERSNQELEQFAYVASHDLQEPLRMVSSYTQLLERRYKDKLDQDANDFIKYAVDGANRMQKLINDLLDYSRISSKGKEFTKVDASLILGQAVSNLHQMITENTALVANEDLPVLNVDESQIVRVFQNLIENAIKYKKKNELPKIHISCKERNDFYEFSVKDNGIGMDMQFHDRVFTIFQRLHSKEEYSGTGIGLSICKRIVERHGGKIWFESKINEGTTFYFTLKK
jgi:PAS domain S-box-containing protein